MNLVPRLASPSHRGSIPSGTVTFVFTDIEGSSELWDRDYAAMQGAVRRHDTVLRAVIASHNGYVFKTIGDAFCAAFSRPSDAIAATVEAVRSLSAITSSNQAALRVRFAVHTGTTDERDGDYFGPVVNRVARLLAIAHGDQIVMSQVTMDLVRDSLPDSVSARDLGEHRLKDLTRSERVYQVLAPDVAADFPPLRSLPVVLNNLPAAMSSFIGREEEIADITEQLRGQRLLTLTGSGGIGKTRAALAVAAHSIDDFGDGVWLIELAPMSNLDYLPSTVAQVLRVKLPAGGEPIANLVDALRAKRALLVLDNCEHVVVSIAHFVAALLQGCGRLKIVTTSRQPLGLAGEVVYRLPSLPVPGPNVLSPRVHELLSFAAVALFIERARAASNTFNLTNENARSVVEICRRLDGIPFAIELAAARIAILSPQQLRERLDERFRVLTGGSRDALPRQRTLRATIDWSHDLLDERERTIFRRLGIFVNGFTLAGAVAVGCGDGLDSSDVLDVLGSLVDKSLVLAEPAGSALRYRLLESIRFYARERLHAASEFDMVAKKRALFFVEIAGDALRESDVRSALAVIETELDNAREVLSWALVERHDVVLGARLALALAVFWSTELPREGRYWLQVAQNELTSGCDELLVADIASAFAAMEPHGSVERFVATERALAAQRRVGEPKSLSKALAAYGEQLSPIGRTEEALAAFDEALALARASGSYWDSARALAGLGLLAVDRKDFAAARDLNYRAMATFEALRATDGIGNVCITLGQAEFMMGNASRAVELTLRARSLHGELNNHRSCACAANYLAAFALEANDLEQARFHVRDSLTLLASDPHPLFLPEAISCAALVATLSGDARRGALLHAYAEARFRNVAHEQGHLMDRCFRRTQKLLSEASGSQTSIDRTAEGAALSTERAVEEALQV